MAVVVMVSAWSLSACGGADARKAKHLARGETYMVAGNYEKARVEIRNALQIAPKDAQARLEMGLVDEKIGSPREAAQFFQAVIDVRPDDPVAHAHLAKLYLLSGDSHHALGLVESALAKFPDDAELLAVRAAVRSQEKDTYAALADAQRAVKLAPMNVDAVEVLAGLYRSMGQTDQALMLLKQSVDRIPDSIDLRLVLAQVYAEEKRPADAEAQLLKIIQQAPKVAAYRLQLAQFYAQSNEIDTAERTLRQASKDLPDNRELKFSLIDFLSARRGREVAEKELTTMIKSSPEDSELRFGLAKFYLQGKQRDKAEVIYNDLIETYGFDPPGLRARDQLASLRLIDGDENAALRLIDEVLAKSARDDDALAMRGGIELARQDPRSAIADLRAVLREQPNAVGLLRSLARAHLANGEPALAEETMRHAVETNPRDPSLQLDLADLLAQMGKPEEAKTILASLVKDKPDDVEALEAQFRNAMRTSDPATAKASADAIVALRPQQAVGYLYQGLLAESEKRPDDALQLYTTAANVQPTAASEPLLAMVRVLAATNRAPEAIKRLDDVIAKRPNDSSALEIKGELLLQQKGHATDAQEVFRTAIARTPKWWRPYVGLANAEAEAGNPASGITTLKNAKSAVGQSEELDERLALLLEQQQKTDEALAEYEEILRVYPQSTMAANNLAMLLATYKKDQGSLDRARDLANRLASSSNPNYQDTYAWVMLKRGDPASSVTVLRRIVAKAPDAVIPRYHLGMAESLIGDNAEARDDLMRVVNSGARFYGLDEAKATLEKLSKTSPAGAEPPKT